MAAAATALQFGKAYRTGAGTVQCLFTQAGIGGIGLQQHFDGTKQRTRFRALVLPSREGLARYGHDPDVVTGMVEDLVVGGGVKAEIAHVDCVVTLVAEEPREVG